MKTRATVQFNRRYAGHYRTAVCRFHNSLYLGCVIGVLLGFGVGHAALVWPRRAWRQLRAGRSSAIASEPANKARASTPAKRGILHAAHGSCTTQDLAYARSERTRPGLRRANAG